MHWWIDDSIAMNVYKPGESDAHLEGYKNFYQQYFPYKVKAIKMLSC